MNEKEWNGGTNQYHTSITLRNAVTTDGREDHSRPDCVVRVILPEQRRKHFPQEERDERGENRDGVFCGS